MQGRAHVGVGGAPPPAFVDGAIRAPEAFLLVPARVLAIGISCLQRRLEERAVEGMLDLRRGHLQRPTVAAVVVGAAIVGLHLLEVRQAVGVGPLRQVVAGPAVEVERVAADEHHAVDGRGAAQDLAARAVNSPPVHVGLRIGVVVPVVAVVVQRPVERGRDPDQESAVARARFEHEDLGSGILGQPRREHAARGAGADDDVVMGVLPHGPCLPFLDWRA